LKILLEENLAWSQSYAGFRVLAPDLRSDVIFLPNGGFIPNFVFERISHHERVAFSGDGQ
jgi:hypothetical protein